MRHIYTHCQKQQRKRKANEIKKFYIPFIYFFCVISIIIFIHFLAEHNKHPPA